jgi:predicted phosphodiesterase
VLKSISSSTELGSFSELFTSRLESATSELWDKHLIVELTTPKELVVIGDLHGDLGSLEKILSEIEYQKFLKDSENKLVFLGDYVDRGMHSPEVLCVLFDLKIRFPDSVIMIRGNHEAPNMFPFQGHTLPSDLKALGVGERTYDKVLNFFDDLPLLCLVENRIVLVHGGLPVSLPSPRNPPRDVIARASMEDPRFVEQVLWNDPKDNLEEPFEKSRRSYGFHYSEKITGEWLALTGAKVVIRGHEPCLGFNILHDEKVLTLFSCRESYPNFKSAYLRIDKKGIELLENASDLKSYIHLL